MISSACNLQPVMHVILDNRYPRPGHTLSKVSRAIIRKRVHSIGWHDAGSLNKSLAITGEAAKRRRSQGAAEALNVAGFNTKKSG